MTFNWIVQQVPNKNCYIRAVSINDSNVYGLSSKFEISDYKTIGGFPLQIGNEWFYKQWIITYPDGKNVSPSTIQEIWRVVDTIKLSDGLKYYQIETLRRMGESNNTFGVTDTLLINQNINTVNVISNKLLVLGPSNFSIKFCHI